MRLAKPAFVDGNPPSGRRLRYVPNTRAGGWPLVLIAFISPVLYLVLRLIYSPVIEAPGYIVPGTPELHVAAYVPQKHAEYAKPGQQATVLFPGGEHRTARITEVAQNAQREVPLSESRTRLGVLVRMDFVDSDKVDEHVQDGMPVQIRFPKRWP